MMKRELLARAASSPSPELELFRQKAMDHGYATAEAELSQGMPGYFYGTMDGDMIMGMDRETGLHELSYGDVGSLGDAEWISGFNAGTRDFVKKHGLPWNSRLPFIDEISRMETYFATRSQREAPLQLKLDGAPLSNSEAGVSLRLFEQTEGLHINRFIQVTSNQLYHGKYGGPYRSPCHNVSGSFPIVPRALPGRIAPTALAPGTKPVALRFFTEAREIRFFWGSPGSHLCFFRFDGIEHINTQLFGFGNDRKHYFAALDLQLGDWIPPEFDIFLNLP